MNILQVKELWKSFLSGQEKLDILRGVDLTLEEATTLVITGESGSGKSTLLNCIAGLEKVSSGTISCAGWEVASLSEHWLSEYRKKSIGFIFQFHYLLNDFTALENVMLPAYMTGLSKREAQERARGLLSEVNLLPRASHYPAELSGGERQRVSVARSLINDPSLILADEPTGNLDEHNSSRVAELLFNLVEKHGKTMLLVTHDLHLAAKADLHLFLESGNLKNL